jgi:hypothetical protein
MTIYYLNNVPNSSLPPIVTSTTKSCCIPFKYKTKNDKNKSKEKEKEKDKDKDKDKNEK